MFTALCIYIFLVSLKFKILLYDIFQFIIYIFSSVCSDGMLSRVPGKLTFGGVFVKLISE